jgi:hypothetical protein
MTVVLVAWLKAGQGSTKNPTRLLKKFHRTIAYQSGDDIISKGNLDGIKDAGSTKISAKTIC